MRKTFQYIFCLVILLLATGSLWAKDKYTVTVLPFTLNSCRKYRLCEKRNRRNALLTYFRS